MSGRVSVTKTPAAAVKYAALLSLVVGLLPFQALPVTAADSAEAWKAAEARINAELKAAIEAGEAPGFVVWAGRHDGPRLTVAVGDRQVEPTREPMTPDTIFDLASLTKPVATATSIHLLAQRERLDLDAPVVRYLPEFGTQGKETVTVRDLLVHRSGLIPDNALKDYNEDVATAWKRLYDQKLTRPRGERFAYSDVGFLILGRIVEVVSEQSLDEFSKQNIFTPLGMNDTGYRPDESLRPRIAPTEKQGEAYIHGRVHDPRASRLGGVAGHAGLFGTGADLGRYAEALLKADRGDTAWIRPETVRRMATGEQVPTGRQQGDAPVLATRGLGWDMQSPYSSNRPAGMSPRSIGHGGFTGTSLWIDLDQDLYVILLSSRLHPDGKGSVNPLAARVGQHAVDAIKGE